MLYAEIAVDTYQDPAKKLFTYRVPKSLETDALEGAQVVIPFGKRVVEGYIWRVTSKKPPFPTKEIQKVKARTFTASQVALSQWMTQHYLAPPLDCLKSQIEKKGARAATAPKGEITTLLLVPYASQVKIRARALQNSRSQTQKAMVGSRSAVFANLPNLKKIIIEEPENWNYKDERSPYYHAKDVAQKRAEIEGLELELRYLSPRIEDIYNEKLNPSGSKSSTRRVGITDLAREKAAGNFSLVSQKLKTLLKECKYTIVYVSSKELQEGIKDELLKSGVGKNFVEVWGPKLFSLPGKEADHIVWADVDTIFNLPDFRAHEKIVWTVRKLDQITKRKVYLQTSFPRHILFDSLDGGDLTNFYKCELKTRRELSYPPFSTLVKLTFTSRSTAKTNLEAEKLHEKLSTLNSKLPTINVSPPYPPYLPTPRKIQLNLAVKIKTCPKRSEEKGAQLEKTLAKLSKVIPPEWKIEVDPESLL
ncbi:MAG: hypothetical protein BMS9Abin34_027 [Patescibacteria group bacterium]|nr:MAG: hypothetical protein BMS9Abin34_027 [Patescibacteria group bacterium]